MTRASLTILLLAGALASGSAALAQPSPPPLNVTAAAPIVVTPSGAGNIARVVSCPTCSISGAGAFPIIAAGATQSVGQMTVTGTNAGMAVVSNGTGGFMLAIPDGTATGGNARGSNAIDLQSVRGSASQVASGTQSFVAGASNSASGYQSVAVGSGNNVSGSQGAAIGANNSVSNTAYALGINNTVGGNSAFAGGQGNTVSGGQSFALGASNSVTNSNAGALGQNITIAGQWSIGIGEGTNDRGAGGAFVQGASGGGGQPQNETYVLAASTTGTAVLRLTLGQVSPTAGTVGAILNNSNQGFAFNAMTIVVKDDVSLGIATFACTSGIVYRASNAASTVLTGGVCTLANTAGTIAVFATLPTITADTSLGALNISATPPAGNTHHQTYTIVERGTFI